jgi:hypothetical protein
MKALLKKGSTIENLKWGVILRTFQPGKVAVDRDSPIKLYEDWETVESISESNDNVELSDYDLVGIKVLPVDLD